MGQRPLRGAGAPATDAGPPPPTATGEAAESPPEPLIATQDQEVEAQAASETASAPQSPVGAVESPVADLVAAAPAPAAEDDAAEIVADTEPAVAASVEPGVAVAPPDDFLSAQAEAPAAATARRERTAMVAIARGWRRRAAGRAVAAPRAERWEPPADGAIADAGTGVSSGDRSARGIAGLRHGSGERSAADRHASAGSPATAGSPVGTARARTAGPRAGTGLRWRVVVRP